MRAFNSGLQIILKYDPVFFINADTIQAFSKEGFTVPMKFYEQKVQPIQGDMTLYWQPFKEKNWTIAFLASVSTIDLQTRERGLPSDAYGWMMRYTVLGMRATLSDIVKVTVGYLYKFYPIILTDEFGKKYFSSELDENNDIAHNETNSCFFHTDILGINLSAIVRAGEGIDLVEFKIPFSFNENYTIISPDIGYFRFHDIVKTGLSVTNEFPVRIENTSIESIIVGLEASSRVCARHDWTGLTSMILTVSFIADRDKSSKNVPKGREFYKKITIGVSYSKELFLEGIAGAFIESSVFNLRLFGNHFFIGNLGVAYNYHYSLYRMPIKNQILIPFSLMWMF